jgi:hypothetical protein
MNTHTMAFFFVGNLEEMVYLHAGLPGGWETVGKPGPLTFGG